MSEVKTILQRAVERAASVPPSQITDATHNFVSLAMSATTKGKQVAENLHKFPLDASNPVAEGMLIMAHLMEAMARELAELKPPKKSLIILED